MDRVEGTALSFPLGVLWPFSGGGGVYLWARNSEEDLQDPELRSSESCDFSLSAGSYFVLYFTSNKSKSPLSFIKKKLQHGGSSAAGN
jgi:hypothetical protein